MKFKLRRQFKQQLSAVIKNFASDFAFNWLFMYTLSIIYNAELLAAETWL